RPTREEAVEPPDRHQPEEGGADDDEHVRPKPGVLPVVLTLQADRTAEPDGDRESNRHVDPVEFRRAHSLLQSAFPTPAVPDFPDHKRAPANDVRLGARRQLARRALSTTSST